MSDTFVRDRLPPPEQQPEFLLLDYPEQLNAAAELLKGGAPDAVAVVDRRTSLTYRELDERSSRLAAVLAAAGVTP